MQPRLRLGRVTRTVRSHATQRLFVGEAREQSTNTRIAALKVVNELDIKPPLAKDLIIYIQPFSRGVDSIGLQKLRGAAALADKAD